MNNITMNILERGAWVRFFRGAHPEVQLLRPSGGMYSVLVDNTKHFEVVFSHVICHFLPVIFTPPT